MSSVYVIEGNEGLVKVGVSCRPNYRRTAIAYSTKKKCVLKYEVDVGDHCYRVERLAHQLLDEHAEGGEWFRVSVEEAIQAVDVASVEHMGIGFVPPSERPPKPPLGMTRSEVLEAARMLMSERRGNES